MNPLRLEWCNSIWGIGVNSPLRVSPRHTDFVPAHFRSQRAEARKERPQRAGDTARAAQHCQNGRIAPALRPPRRVRAVKAVGNNNLLATVPGRWPKSCSKDEIPKVDCAARLGLLKLQRSLFGDLCMVNRRSSRALFGPPHRAPATSTLITLTHPGSSVRSTQRDGEDAMSDDDSGAIHLLSPGATPPAWAHQPPIEALASFSPYCRESETVASSRTVSGYL